MLLKTIISIAFAASCASAAASILYISAYSGPITSLSLSCNHNKSYALQQLSSTKTIGALSWLTLDKHNRILYSMDEGLDPEHGNVVSYKTDSSGHLSQIMSVANAPGDVASSLYGHGNAALAVAHYAGSAFTTYTVSAQGTIHSLQNFTFTMPGPGPNKVRQDAPHPHEVIIDPTKTYILVPDLGADLVRVFRIDYATNKLTALDPLEAKAGSGPRHGVFWGSRSAGTYFFLVSELANSVTAYKVTYRANNGGLNLAEKQVINSFAGSTVPAGTAAGEVATSANGHFLLVSNRGDNSSTLPSGQKSDTMATYSIDHYTGMLCPVGLFPAGGSVPRQFSLNRNGTLAAVALQNSSLVVILPFHEKSGKFGEPVAQLKVQGGTSYALWDE